MSEENPKIEDFPEVMAATIHLSKVCADRGYFVVGAVLIPTKTGTTDIQFGSASSMEEWLELFHIVHRLVHSLGKETDRRLVDLSKRDA